MEYKSMSSAQRTKSLVDGYSSNVSRAAPSMAAIKAYDDIESFIKGEALTAPDDIGVYIGIYCAFHDIPFKGAIYKKPDLMMKDLVDMDSKNADKILAKDYLTVFGGIQKGNLANMPTYFDKGKIWVVELVMCYQVKALNRGNIVNYFKSCGVNIVSTDFIINFLKVAAGSFDKLVGIDDVRDEARKNKFVFNHTNYASSGALVTRCIEELGPVAKFVFNAEDITAAGASAQAPWDMPTAELVTEVSKVITYVYLDVGDSLPDNWYQGTRAYDNAPATFKKALRAFFKNHKKILSEAGNYEDSNTLFKMVTAMPKFLKRGSAKERDLEDFKEGM